MPDEEVLHGGVANAGGVVRSGDYVLRPSNAHSESIHTFFTRVKNAGFDGVPTPVGIDADGRERLEFIPGDVAVPPFPEWAQSDDALASVAILLRGLHDASEQVELSDLVWSAEMADPVGGPVVCHNDACLENVVFESGKAIALIDFDFAAMGRRTFDVASFARYCVPIDDEVNATRLGWYPADRPSRLRLLCDAYGLVANERAEVLTGLSDAIAQGGEFVRRRAEAGEPGFVQMWNDMGGMERFDRRRRWWSQSRSDFAAALT